MVTRADLVLTPTVSLQLYLQPLISVGRYWNLKELAAPRTFAELRAWFSGPGRDIEGVVWWHADGRMVKIKAKDFGVSRIANVSGLRSAPDERKT